MLYYSSLTFEVEEVWCTDGTGTSGWVSVEWQKFPCWWMCQGVQGQWRNFDNLFLILSGLSDAKWSLKNDDNWKSQIVPVETHNIKLH